MIPKDMYGTFNEPLHELWDKQIGRAPFIATVPKQHFKFWIRILCFDEKTTQEARKMNDIFAPVQEFFDLFNNQFRNSYKLSDDVTIDKILRRFRGCYTFKVLAS